MPAHATADTFLDMLRRSGLLPAADLDKYLSRVADPSAVPADDLAGRMIRDGLLTPFQASHLLKGRYKNFFIGKFKVLQPLGSGGMSQVFLCEHVTLRHRVALKLLPVKASKDPAAVGRFQREARAAAGVNHPHVVRAHDFDQSADGKFYYLVMDYVDGVNLHDLVTRHGPLPPRQAAHYVAQSALGLQHIHECGLIHRDIKPGNLLLDRAGVVRILDLGLVRYTDDEEDNLTRRMNGHTVLGTADFLAPEQAMMTDALDGRADLYSLGATLYFLLAGQAPFQNLATAQKLMAHQLREPDPIPGLQPELAAVLFTMMRKEPKERFPSAAAVADALANWTAAPLPAPDPALFPPTGTPSSGPRSAPPSSRSLVTASPLSRPAMPTATVIAMSGTELTASTLPDSLPIVRPNRRPLLLGGALAVAAVAVGIAFLTFNPFAGSRRPAPTTGPVADHGPADPTSVALPAGAIGVGPGQAHATVADALKGAPPGSRILLTAAEHAEQLTLVGGAGNIEVQGWPEDRPVVWRRPDGESAGPLLTLTDVPGFSLSNVRLDGKGTMDTLVRIAGRCPGLVLDGVTAVGFRSAAVRLAGVQAEANRPAVVRRLRATGPGEAAVLLADAPSRHVLLDRCRFDGLLRDGVRVAVPADRLTVRFTRFDLRATGVSLAGDAAAHAITLHGNTFAGCDTGLLVGAVTAANPKIVVTDNLFVRTAATARAADADARVLSVDSAPWVWHDDGLDKEKQTNVPAGVRLFRKVVELPAAPADAMLDVGCADRFEVWVNGTRVGASDPPHFTKRVFAFPVGQRLKPGTNVIAVKGTHTRDPLNPGFATAAGLVVRLAAGATEPLAVTDASWRSFALADGAAEPADWTQPDFDDATWKPVRVWEAGPHVMPWYGAVWDSRVAAAFNLPSPVPFTAAGNVRDYASHDGFPLLNAVRGKVPPLPEKNLDDDATYLRTPRSAEKLLSLGHKGGPVGVPLDR